ncbi:MAG: hypothetical protein E6J91_47730 [Deltaproteobacteria bacterium]|nr:MAG: hypothetical protein E6J91_47730 [Deltaproteobacteria bacterium]
MRRVETLPDNPPAAAAVATDVRGKPAVVISIAVHGAVLAVVVHGDAVPAVTPRATDAVPELARPAPAEGEAIAIAFVDDASGASPSGPRTASRSDVGGGRAAGLPGPRGDARIAGSRGGEAGESPERGPGSRWLKMRGPELTLGDAFLARIARDTPPLETVRRSGRVEPSGRGTAVIRDRVTTVTIDRDGSAHFHDKPDVEIHWDLHLPTPDEIVREVRQGGRDIATWYEDPYKRARVGPSQDVPRHLSAMPGACDSWQDACSTELRLRGQPENEDRPDAVAHGKLDLTAMLMRRTVGDPYASRKLALLDASRDERADLGARHRKEDLARSAELMQRNLEALWAATTDPAARRQALFTLWDECSEGDGLLGEAGERARRLVIGWIRARLPAGSPEAFTPEDIAQLGARRTSKQAFAPYE